MKTTLFAFAASLLLSAVAAGPYHDRRNVQNAIPELKGRDECTQCSECKTIWTTIIGAPTLIQPAAPSTSSIEIKTTSTPSPTSISILTSATSVPPPSTVPAPSETSSAAPVSEPSSTPLVASKAQGSAAGSFLQSSSSGSSGQISTGGSLYAMAYTPYKGTSPGNSRCAEASEVSSDIKAIASKGFKTVRLYATDCNGLQHVGDAAKASGLKMIVGIYVDHSGLDADAVTEQIKDIKDYFNGDYSQVEMVLLGNEALFNNFVTADALATKLGSLKKELSSAGYNGPVSTADTLAALQEHEGTLCDSLDILAANIHPFFNDATSALAAGSFVNEQMSGLQSLCGGSKKAINSETGWPNNGDSNGAAIPSTAEQLIAIESIKAAAGGHSVFFSFENDLWKAGGYLNVENAWGCGEAFA